MAQSFGAIQITDLELHSVNEALRLLQSQIDQLSGLGDQAEVAVAPHTHAALGEPVTILTPPRIKKNQNDYAPVGFAEARMLRLSSKEDVEISGMQAASDGDYKILHNVGEFTITLMDESPRSAIANRFALATSLTITKDSIALIQYDKQSQRWRSLVAGVTDHTHEVGGEDDDGGGGTGGALNFTQGSVLFGGGSSGISEDNANFFWDDTNNRLGISTTIPISTLDVRGIITITNDTYIRGISILGLPDVVNMFKVGTDDRIHTETTLRPTGTGVARLGLATARWVDVATESLDISGNILTSNVAWIGQAADGSGMTFSNDVIINGLSGVGINLNSNNAGAVGDFVLAKDRSIFSGGTVLTTVDYNNGHIMLGPATTPTIGSFGIIFPDGTALATMASNTAGLYADDVSGTVNMFAINEAGLANQLSGIMTADSGITVTDSNGTIIHGFVLS